LGSRPLELDYGFGAEPKLDIGHGARATPIRDNS
jgi:hypothetical protein